MSRARSSPRKSGGAEAQRVGIREREDVLRGAQEHGAGSATPKERQARPTAEVLAAFPVTDDPNDADYGASPAGGRKLKLATLSLDMDSMSQLTWPTVTGEHGAGKSSCFDDVSTAPPGGLRLESAPTSSRLTRTQRMVGLSIVALVGLFVVVQTLSEAYPTYIWASAIARNAARRLDVLYAAADGLVLVFALALHVLVFALQLAVACFPQIVLGALTVGVVAWRWKWSV